MLAKQNGYEYFMQNGLPGKESPKFDDRGFKFEDYLQEYELWVKHPDSFATYYEIKEFKAVDHEEWIFGFHLYDTLNKEI